MAGKKLPPGVRRRPSDNVLEKDVPHFDLAQIKALVAQLGEKVFTFTALQGVQLMTLSKADAVAAIVAMDGNACFYKAMTSYHDENLWQDVYHVPTPKGLAYVKFQVVLPPAGSKQTPKLVIQFKAK